MLIYILQKTQKGDDFMYSKQIVTIVSITKNQLNFCSARQMDVVVRTKDGKFITIPWANMPCMGSIPSKPTTHFAFFWHYGESGMPATLFHGKDATFNYLEPMTN